MEKTEKPVPPTATPRPAPPLRELLPTGACHYCTTPLRHFGQLYCDSGCRNLHEDDMRNDGEAP